MGPRSLPPLPSLPPILTTARPTDFRRLAFWFGISKKTRFPILHFLLGYEQKIINHNNHKM